MVVNEFMQVSDRDLSVLLQNILLPPSVRSPREPRPSQMVLGVGDDWGRWWGGRDYHDLQEIILNPRSPVYSPCALVVPRPV